MVFIRSSQKRRSVYHLDLEDDAIISNHQENDTQSIDNIDGSEITETDSHGVPTDQSKIKKVVEPPPVQGNDSLR